jgi:hypothetical protein
MEVMLVTEETSQLERSPSFQLEMLPVKAVSLNIPSMSDTPERVGLSVASFVICDAPQNALCMLSHVVFPHCFIDMSFSALGRQLLDI